MLGQLIHFVFNTLYSLRVADVVSLNVRLGQKRVVDLQLRVESQRTNRWEENSLFLMVFCLDMMRHETTQIGYDHAVVVEQ